MSSPNGSDHNIVNQDCDNLIPYIPPEMKEHIIKFMDSSTLQTCLEIPYLTKMAQKELDKRYRCCIKILTELEIDEEYAIGLINDGRLDLSSVSENLTEMNAIILTQYFNKINMLDLRGCPNITDITLKTLSQYCSSLKTIILNRCNNITDNGIITIVKKCPKLKTIMFSHCPHITDISITTILDNCPNIDFIVLKCGCPNITEHSRQLLRNRNIRIW